jgi:hypothetical protein
MPEKSRIQTPLRTTQCITLPKSSSSLYIKDKFGHIYPNTPSIVLLGKQKALSPCREEDILKIIGKEPPLRVSSNISLQRPPSALNGFGSMAASRSFARPDSAVPKLNLKRADFASSLPPASFTNLTLTKLAQKTESIPSRAKAMQMQSAGSR